MATTPVLGGLKVKDDDGNIRFLYPSTSADQVEGLAAVATSGAYSDLTGTPSFASVATSGSYNDLTNKPSIPAATVVDAALSSTSENAVQNKAIYTALAGKSDTSHDHTFASLTSKPTTLSGYGITDATIANGVITLGANSITPLTQHQDISGKADVSALSGYLTLSGGTMTGNIQWEDANDDLAGVFPSDTNIDFGWKYHTSAGALIGLRSANHATQPGEFSLFARTPSAVSVLLGKPDGSLTWNNTAISLDGHTHSYLPLSGGTMTGGISTSTGNFVIKTANTGYLRFLAGTNSDSSHRGANLLLYGPEVTDTATIGGASTSLAGVFYLCAHNTSASTFLIGVPGNRVYWGNNPLAYVSELSAYLPLTGGDVTGLIKVTTDSGSGFRHDHTNGTSLRFGVGSGGANRGIYQGQGNSHYDGWLLYWDSNGAFGLRTENNGAAGNTLAGNPTGNLTWGGTKVALSTDLASYLPLAGGTMTGHMSYNMTEFQIKGTGTAQAVMIAAGSAWNNSPSLSLYGTTRGDANAGTFSLRAGANANALIGKPDGTLTWGGTAISLNGHTHSYLPLSGGTMTGSIRSGQDDFVIDKTVQTGRMIVRAGSAYANGASLYLHGKEHSSEAGNFSLTAHNGTTAKSLAGKPDGTLTWGGTAISLNGHTHSQYLTEHQSLSNCAKLNGDNSVSTGNWAHRNAGTSFLRLSGGASVSTGANILLYGNTHSSNAGRFYIYCNDGSTTKNLNGTVSGTLQWNGQTVSTSSDERLKTAFSQIPDEALDAWGKVNWHRFKFREDAERKGLENCRWHPGLVAQRVKAVFEADGLDACAYGILCHDEWGDEYDEDGSLTREAGDLWMIRYEEALAMEAAYQRRRADRLEERIVRLEALMGGDL